MSGNAAAKASAKTEPRLASELNKKVKRSLLQAEDRLSAPDRSAIAACFLGSFFKTREWRNLAGLHAETAFVSVEYCKKGRDIEQVLRHLTSRS
jgi:hypothetical protein